MPTMSRRQWFQLHPDATLRLVLWDVDEETGAKSVADIVELPARLPWPHVKRWRKELAGRLPSSTSYVEEYLVPSPEEVSR